MSYPYKLNIERRLSNGKITTNGYAAKHPVEFMHWRLGPNDVYGEDIDMTDWQDWYNNYYGLA